VPKPFAILQLFPYSRAFNCTGKALAGSPKAEIDPNLLAQLTKCYSKVATRSYMHGWTSFNRTKLCPSRLLSYFFHIPVSIALVKLVGWFTKGGN
jgi:hypothetical protein